MAKERGIFLDQTVRRLTEGSITKTLVRFAAPYLAANFLQALYGAVDLLVVGWFCSSESVSAVSTGAQIMQIILSLISGLTMGGTILIAQYVGAKRIDQAADTISTMFSLFGIISVVMTVVMLACASPLLMLMQTPKEAFGPALDYVLIASAGTVFVIGYNAVSAILRGLGDSRHPLIFIAISCVCNILLDLAAVGLLGMGAGGAALATIISQGLSFVIAIIYLKRNNFIFDFKRKSFHLHKDKALSLIKIGIPVSLQDTTVHISFMFITAIVNSMGVVASAAVGVCSRFDAFAMLPPTAFSGAISALAAQNIGANQPERAKKTLYMSMLLSFACSLVFFAWAQLSPQSVMTLFQFDPQVTVAGAEYLRTFSFDFLLVAFAFCFSGFFNGCGCTRYTMITGIATTLGIRVPLAFLFSQLMPDSLYGIGLAAPIATVVSILVHVIVLRTPIWRNASVIKQSAEEQPAV